MNNQLVLLDIFQSTQAAYEFRAFLDSNEIWCLISGDNATSIDPRIPGGVQILVESDDLAQARDLLQEFLNLHIDSRQASNEKSSLNPGRARKMTNWLMRLFFS